MISQVNCTGCGACVVVCPKKCINLEKNNRGFLSANIDYKRCINCKKCESVCTNFSHVQKNKPKECVAAYSIKPKDVLSSSSGGIFTVLSKYFFENNGIVFGAAFDDYLKLRHIYATNEDELHKLKGSKYIQSDISDAYRLIEGFLNEGKRVLFVGTPCQVGALSLFFKNDRNLYLVDLVCHGTVSERVFYDYVKELEKKHKSRVSAFHFRSKKLLSSFYGFECEFENGSISIVNGGYTSLGKAFFSGIAMKDSCYRCQFANDMRCGDITLCDFWGGDKKFKEFYNNNGTSCILINTDKGNDLVKHIQEQICSMSVNLQDIKKENHNLNNPTKYDSRKETFWNDYDQEGYDYVRKKYFKCSIKETIKKKYDYFNRRTIHI